MMDEPSPANHFQAEHAGLLLDSYQRLTGRHLLPACIERNLAARELYLAPFVVLSHDTAADPLFTYANLAAQRLFEMPWGEIVGLPSRHSAGPMEQRARQKSLEQVARQGFMDHYRAVRVSRGGKRFLILEATIWNLVGADGQPLGQAATFDAWRALPDDAAV